MFTNMSELRNSMCMRFKIRTPCYDNYIVNGSVIGPPQAKNFRLLSWGVTIFMQKTVAK